jgi:hypothetical protein
VHGLAAQSPHEHTRTPLDYPEVGLEGEHNSCRNPDGEPTAWCYTTDAAARWEVCDVGDPSADCPAGPAPPPSIPGFEGTQRYCQASALDYRGTVAETVSGATCMDWAAQSPHEHTRTPLNYPEFGLEGEHNYCRNPDGEPTAWCYTTDASLRWQVCDVGEPSDCEMYCEATATDYRGQVSATVSGRTCMAWAEQSPHSHTRTPLGYPEFGLEGSHNYCRNPDGEPTAWCYTIDDAKRWEICDVGEVSSCPYSVTYLFAGDADDSAGNNHGVITGATLTVRARPG